MMRYAIIQRYPHDKTAFTQGLAAEGDEVIESTGLYGNSSVRRIQLPNGNIQQRVRLPAHHFGEGVTVWENTILQLTWKNELLLIYDRSTLSLQRMLPLQGEGWGLTNDFSHLIMSDGTSYIRFLDPSTLEHRRSIRVTYQGRSVSRLNDIQYADGCIFSNVWHLPLIAVIRPDDGRVLDWLDMRELAMEAAPLNYEAVLNGIARRSPGRLLVTGKLWKYLYEIAIF